MGKSSFEGKLNCRNRGIETPISAFFILADLRHRKVHQTMYFSMIKPKFNKIFFEVVF